MPYKRNEKIDVLKGICILFVVITHFEWSGESRLHFLFPFWIDQAVPIFMIISGYLLAKTFEYRKISCLSEAYNRKYIVEKMVRFLLPFAIIFSIEIVIELKRKMLYRLCDGRIINGILSLFIVGGVGPGAYYVPVMIQLVLAYPFVYFLVKKFDYLAVIRIFILSLIWEYLKVAYGMSDYEYRLLIVRYLFAVSVGCYFAIGKTILTKAAAATVFGAGLVWLIIDQYYHHMPFFLNKNWSGTSCLDVMYIAPVIFCYLGNKVNFAKLPVLQKMGKASYHIFLFQKLFYSFLYSYVGRFLDNKFEKLIIFIIICVSGGVIFYRIESKISKYAIEYIRKKISKFDGKISMLFGRLVKSRV